MLNLKFREIPRSNSFDFIRLFLASFIVYAHSLRFGGYWNEPYFNTSDHSYLHTTLGNICVYMFFAISGYFITMSFFSSGSSAVYLIKRIKRIYPALWVCLLVIGFTIVPLILIARGQNLSISYCVQMAINSLMYLDSNFTGQMNSPSIGHVLDGQPHPVLDGSLWSIIYEVKAYLLVASFGFLGLLKNKRLMLLLTALMLLVYSTIVMNSSISQLVHARFDLAMDIVLIS
jgi:peptidoglycan/LPS O-acetylase OafA/YrhL